MKMTKVTIESLFRPFFSDEDMDDEDCELDTLDDGVWDITDIPRLMIGAGIHDTLSPEEATKAQAFIELHGGINVAIGAAYSTGLTILLARTPKQVNTWEGQFNYGSNAIVTNCPKEIMILAEND
jgi:hypothetical protein